MTKQDKLNKLAKAANALKEAHTALAQIAIDTSDHHYICPDAAYYRSQIWELLDGDGDGGLESLIRIVERELS